MVIININKGYFMNLIIRNASIDDLQTIQNLNNELCKYETKNNFDSYIEDY